MKDTTKAQITMHYSPEYAQLEEMINTHADECNKAREAVAPTAHRTAIRRITRPMLIMLALTFAAWLVTLLGSLGVVDPVTAEAVKGVCLVVTLISAVVVTVRVMGSVGNAD